jgi:hypothetical protein
MRQKRRKKDSGWLLIFYSLPSKPVNNRVRIWRKLAQIGAIQLRGGVYILPYSEDHYERFQWLMSEITSAGGEGNFIRADKIETLKEKELIDFFNKQRDADYRDVETSFDELQQNLDGIKKGGREKNHRAIRAMFNKHRKRFEDIEKVDFFVSETGRRLKNRIEAIEAELDALAQRAGKTIRATAEVAIARRRIKDYRKRIWTTRKRPFVDRMASAWLIKTFIDKDACFEFRDEKEIENPKDNMVTFDVRGGEFTHKGDMCTFEVLLKAFGLKDSALRKIAEIVHNLDLKDEKYRSHEMTGIEQVLIGIRKTAKDDQEMLKRGMEVFEMLYASKT